jgi:uncharacterized protein (DUF427 family)
MKAPGPEHPIHIARHPSRVVVKVAGRVVAESTEALVMREAKYPPVYYVPRNDVDMSLLSRTNRTTTCPYKGDASYFSVLAGGEQSVNAAWSYECPYAHVSQIKEHVAFYSDRVDSITA